MRMGAGAGGAGGAGGASGARRTVIAACRARRSSGRTRCPSRATRRRRPRSRSRPPRPPPHARPAAAAPAHKRAVAGRLLTSRVHGRCGADLTQTGAVLVQAQVALERVQLAHEVEVGRDVRLAAAHQLEGVAQAEAVALHEVGQRHRDGARHARHAVHQHAAARRHRLLCTPRTTHTSTLRLRPRGRMWTIVLWVDYAYIIRSSTSLHVVHVIENPNVWVQPRVELIQEIYLKLLWSHDCPSNQWYIYLLGNVERTKSFDSYFNFALQLPQ